MMLRGELREIMVQVDPKLYRPFVSLDRKGTPVLYVQLFKSMYGLLRSALLFYRKLKKEFIEYGFIMNPYDPCVANKDTPAGQMTVVWHVDDFKYHARILSKLLNSFICWMAYTEARWSRIAEERMTT